MGTIETHVKIGIQEPLTQTQDTYALSKDGGLGNLGMFMGSIVMWGASALESMSEVYAILVSYELSQSWYKYSRSMLRLSYE